MFSFLNRWLQGTTIIGIGEAPAIAHGQARRRSKLVTEQVHGPIRPQLRLRRRLPALVLALMAAPAFGQQALIDALRDGSGKRVLVAAHRAAHDIYPENSLPAIERAISLGFDIVEIDVRLTRDGVPILMHDESIDRMTDGKGKVKELSFARIEALHLKGAEGTITDLRVPTLYEAMKLAKGRILVNLDLKTADVDPTISRIVETGTLAQTLLFSGNYDLLKKLRAIAPGALVLPRAHSTGQVRVASSTLKPEVIHIDETFNTDATRRAARASDSRLWIKALGEPDKLVVEGKLKEAIDPLLAHGASVIETDHPAEVIAYLGSIGRR
jgi:glycerophosphoryl diester phosphodiesterase